MKMKETLRWYGSREGGSQMWMMVWGFCIFYSLFACLCVMEGVSQLWRRRRTRVSHGCFRVVFVVFVCRLMHGEMIMEEMSVTIPNIVGDQRRRKPHSLTMFSRHIPFNLSHTQKITVDPILTYVDTTLIVI